jgi:hypothetical protein
MRVGLIALSLLLLTAGEMLAQSDRASITGTVRDASGDVMQGVQVTVTNAKNALQENSVTNEMGSYNLLNLPIGLYTLDCSKDGFGKYRRSGISLAISQVAEIDIVLVIGPNTETATVTGDAPVLQTQTSSISTNLVNAAVTELPLNVQGGRNLSSFMFAYVPGVEGSDFDSHIVGSLSKSKEVMIDGTSAVAQIGGYLSESSPPMEAVEEFQVTSAGIRADEGRSGGGVFRYEMKSGSNAWHGSGFYYMHDEAFDARSWGSKFNETLCLDAPNIDSAQAASCQRAFGKPDDPLYTYGASFGGPIKKGKLFFYSAWERYTFANIGIGALGSTVPTTAFLDGDFSALLDKSVVLGTDNAGQPVYQGAIIDSQTGDAFPGNIIPPSRISKVSQGVVDLFKKDYQPLSPGLTNNNALPLASPATSYQSNQFSTKLDYNLSQKRYLSGSFIYAYIPRLLSDQGGVWSAGSVDGGPLANAYDHNTTAPSVRLSDSWTISDTLVNVFSVTFNRFRNPSEARSQQGNWPSKLGLSDFGSGNFPVIKFQGVNGDQHRFVAGKPIDESGIGSQFNDFYAANTFIYNESLLRVKGRHMYRFGAEFRVMQINSHGDSGVPTLVFDPAQTAGNFSSNAGFGFASFLLGDVNQASVTEPDNTYGRRKALSLYAQDNIKATSKFTLNLDLRWDFNGRYHEKYGRWSTFNTTAINPVTGLSGDLEFATSGDDSFEKKQYYHNFSGHIGGAYQLTPQTVARASFGVFYVPLNLNTFSGVAYGFNPGFILNNQVLTPFDWDSGYPGHAVDVGKDPNFTRFGMVSIDPHALELGNVQEWFAGLEREISRDLLLSVDFVQNHGYHLESGYVAANQPKLSDYTALVQSGQQFSIISKPGFTGFGWASVAPFPNVAMTFGPLFYVGSPYGNSDYRSLQFTVKKRAARGLSALASYNLSSSHGDTDTSFEDLFFAGPLQDVYNLQQERHTISSFDQKHVVKGYVLYELPFGRRKALLSDARSWLDALVGGWTVSSGFHYSTGMPMRITANVFYPGINNVYANIVPGCDISAHYNGQVGGTYFNPACFANPANGEFGDAPGYLAQLRKPGLASEDVGISKSLRFGGERYLLSLRFQVFNVFNRHGFAGPNTQIGTADFGKVLPEDLNGLPGPRVGQFGARLAF